VRRVRAREREISLVIIVQLFEVGPLSPFVLASAFHGVSLLVEKKDKGGTLGKTHIEQSD
jgi:hypothetical protein